MADLPAALQDLDEYDDEVDCTWCAGEGTAECLDPLGCTMPHPFGGECICTACRGTGQRSEQTVF